MTLPFWKTEALSNDFVLVLSGDTPGLDFSKLAEETCDRRTGIGADGLLVLDPQALKLRMFNPDGTEDFCGNGLRCAIDHLAWKFGQVSPFTIEHGGQHLKAEIYDDGEVSVTLGAPSFEPKDVPLSTSRPLWMTEVEGVKGSAISTGSTHFVVLVDQLPEDERFFDISPRLEHDPLFPARTSVIWTKADGDTLNLRIWERGAGETFGCGTGSAAAACVWSRQRGYGGELNVVSRGGEVKVTLPDDLSFVKLTSKVHRAFSGEYLVRQAVMATK